MIAGSKFKHRMIATCKIVTSRKWPDKILLMSWP